MRFLFLTLILTLYGCSSPPAVSISSNAKIGMIVEGPNYFCHDHTGVTVFQNFINYYDLENEKIDSAIFEGYKKGFLSYGFEIKRVVISDLFGPNYSGVIYNKPLSPEVKAHFLSAVEDMNLDLVLYADTAYDKEASGMAPPHEVKNYCSGNAILFTGYHGLGAKVIAYSGDTVAIDVKSAKNIGRLHLNESPLFSAIQPTNMEVLTSKDIDQFLVDLKKNAEFKAGLIAKHLTSKGTG